MAFLSPLQDLHPKVDKICVLMCLNSSQYSILR